MKLNYRLNCDDYVLHDGDKPIGVLLTEVAVVFGFDEQDGLWIRYKTGSPEALHAWVNRNKSGHGSASFKLHIIEGKLPIDALNLCMENGQHVRALLEQCQAITDTQDLERGLKRVFKLDGVSLNEIPFSMSRLRENCDKQPVGRPGTHGRLLPGGPSNDFLSGSADVMDVQEKPPRYRPT